MPAFLEREVTAAERFLRVARQTINAPRFGPGDRVRILRGERA